MRRRLARPLSVAGVLVLVAPDGARLVADDEAGAIYRITYADRR